MKKAAAKKKVAKVMREFKKGELNIGKSAKKVKSRKQAVFNYGLAPTISRDLAVQVPAVARAKNIIAGTISSIPLEVRSRSTKKPPRRSRAPQRQGHHERRHVLPDARQRRSTQRQG